jgi:hypothetical protein
MNNHAQLITMESIRRFRNPGRIECFWDPQEKKSVKGRKKLLQFIAASMFWLVWTARGKNACKLQVLLVMLLHNEESNRELKSWL